jgi:hypothetical protein
VKTPLALLIFSYLTIGDDINWRLAMDAEEPHALAVSRREAESGLHLLNRDFS